MKAGLSAYVAAPFEDYKRAQTMMNRLRSVGVAITHDWTKDAVEALENGKSHTDGEMYRCAIEDRDGARDADLFVMLAPDSKEKGCAMYSELAFALDGDAYVIISGPLRDRNLFSKFAHAKFENDEDVADHVARGLLLLAKAQQLEEAAA